MGLRELGIYPRAGVVGAGGHGLLHQHFTSTQAVPVLSLLIRHLAGSRITERFSQAHRAQMGIFPRGVYLVGPNCPPSHWD